MQGCSRVLALKSNVSDSRNGAMTKIVGNDAAVSTSRSSTVWYIVGHYTDSGELGEYSGGGG